MTVAVPVPGDALARFSEVPFRIAVQVIMPALRPNPTPSTRCLGIAVERPASLVAGDITSCEDIDPEDTFDADDGRLLERAYGKGEGWRPQRVIVPRDERRQEAPVMKRFRANARPEPDFRYLSNFTASSSSVNSSVTTGCHGRPDAVCCDLPAL